LHLEWIYQQAEALQGNPAEEEKENHKISHIPPEHEIRNLFELAITGDLRELLLQLDRIEQLHHEFSYFTAKVRKFARSFQIDHICEFLGKYVGRKL
jgi:hypothetical protein